MHTPREKQARTQEQPLVRFGLGLANWSERWFPDPLIFALLGIVVVFVVGLLLRIKAPPNSPSRAEKTSGRWFLSPCRW
jgi:short subunit fatty acids transporter